MRNVPQVYIKNGSRNTMSRRVRVSSILRFSLLMPKVVTRNYIVQGLGLNILNSTHHPESLVSLMLLQNCMLPMAALDEM